MPIDTKKEQERNNDTNFLAEFDVIKNLPIKPNNVTSGSHKKVWFLCKKGHSYAMAPAEKSRGQGCPYCVGKRVLAGFNDLNTTHSKIAHYWDYDLNFDVTPDMVSSGSQKKYWFKCPQCGKSYQMTLNSRCKVKDIPLCYSCSKKRGSLKKIKEMISTGHTLKNNYPDIAKEWHPSKNGFFTPNNVTPSSGRKVWWLCPVCGTEWQQTIHTRTKGEGCPHCGHAYQTSEPEQIIFYYIKKVFPDSINSYKSEFLGRKEIDIYIPSIKTGIEYDGAFWHKNKTVSDTEKALILKENGIYFIRLYEETLSSVGQADYLIRTTDYYSNPYGLNAAIKELFNHLNKQFGLKINIMIDVKQDYQKIVDLFTQKKRNRSFALVRPDLINEWHPTKNGLLTPYNTVASSHKNIWWICNKCRNEWETKPASRYSLIRGTGCPVCAQDKVNTAMKKRNLITGKTDLATVCTEMANEWDYEKNATLPSQYTIKSNQRVWWKCKLGHEWEATIASRTKSDGHISQCPYCSNRYVLAGYNDLATTHPSLALQWNQDKNKNLSPQLVSSGSNKKVWWICNKCGNEWEATISHRVNGRGCPICANKRKGKR